MAETTTTTTRSVKFGFEDDRGDSMSITYSGVKEAPSEATMKGVFNALIDNGQAFEKMPVTLKSVDYIETVSESYPLANFDAVG